ncbi:hypothetical protein ORI20_06230 [Mycobacterium sp. CVI_P3]|uniref:Uncharacterized protein n=1 Tax=Mycobacterium pinniadriaticum TaxID=2994102 RepID=A0ABT3SAF9_9MYCO|nr:hypothetical protein [Mycobacterium pinniadriaticum]MCX2929860.1 hypothetical protein [Mycobacterium pinniadriaticum]MCX2936491.1 hypothetical protein [Mycobacterium pinniadriaticum]
MVAAVRRVDATPPLDLLVADEVCTAANTLEIAVSAAFAGFRGVAVADAEGRAADEACIDDFGFAVVLAARGPAWPLADVCAV